MVPIVKIVESYKADQEAKLRKLNRKKERSKMVDEKTNEEGESEDEFQDDNQENSGKNLKTKNEKNEIKSHKPLVSNSDIKYQNDHQNSSKDENKNNIGNKENN